MTKILVLQALRVIQLLYSVTEVNNEIASLHAAVLPELQPAHSCGLPVSVRADYGLPSVPDAEPEHTSTIKQHE